MAGYRVQESSAPRKSNRRSFASGYIGRRLPLQSLEDCIGGEGWELVGFLSLFDGFTW